MILTDDEIRKAAEFAAEQMWPESGYVGWTEDDAVFHRKFIEAFDALLQPTALPERDPSKPAEAQGLFHKFNVTRTDGSDQPGGKHHGCAYFVLDVDHDPHAKAALQAYAVACAQSHPQLSADLIARHGGGALIDTVIRKVEYLSETVENCTAMTIINALEEMKASPAALPVGELTLEQITRIYDRYGGDMVNCTRAIERELAAARSQPTTEESSVVAVAQPVREPMTLGEPFGKAVFKVSHDRSNGITKKGE